MLCTSHTCSHTCNECTHIIYTTDIRYTHTHTHTHTCTHVHAQTHAQTHTHTHTHTHAHTHTHTFTHKHPFIRLMDRVTFQTLTTFLSQRTRLRRMTSRGGTRTLDPRRRHQIGVYRPKAQQQCHTPALAYSPTELSVIYLLCTKKLTFYSSLYRLYNYC